MPYHVLSRGNNGQTVFHKPDDYEAFLKAIAHACVEVPMRVLGYCLMPNHFHLVVWPEGDGDLSRWMHWLLNTHVRRYHRHHERTGHVWQGRFKSFPIQSDEHLLTVLRYVERNPARAKLVRRAELYRWSSARLWSAEAERPGYLIPGPVRRPKDWLGWVNAEIEPKQLESLRGSVERGAPFGGETWTSRVAKELGLEATIRPRGRPRKIVEH
jgi:putative transposase